MLRFGNNDHGACVVSVAVHDGTIEVIEERRELVKIFLGKRIKFMIVAGGASHGQSHKHGGRGFYPVLGIDGLVFCINGSSF